MSEELKCSQRIQVITRFVQKRFDFIVVSNGIGKFLKIKNRQIFNGKKIKRINSQLTQQREDKEMPYICEFEPATVERVLDGVLHVHKLESRDLHDVAVALTAPEAVLALVLDIRKTQPGEYFENKVEFCKKLGSKENNISNKFNIQS